MNKKYKKIMLPFFIVIIPIFITIILIISKKEQPKKEITPFIPNIKTLLAKKAQYILENNLLKFNVRKSNIIPPEADTRAIITGESVDAKLFSKKLIQNIKKNTFENDIYYSDITKHIENRYKKNIR